jgi:phasin family protein
MNKTRFQLPPRADSAAGVDRWVTAGSAVAATPPVDFKIPLASGEPAKQLASMKFPCMFDIAALFDTQRRNIEALAAANKIVLEGARSMARRNVVLMQQSIDGVLERLQAMGNPECPSDRAMRQTETVIKAYEDASSNMREIGAMMQHANSEAMDVLTRRFTEATDEVKSLARHAAANVWATEGKVLAGRQ